MTHTQRIIRASDPARPFQHVPLPALLTTRSELEKYKATHTLTYERVVKELAARGL